MTLSATQIAQMAATQADLMHDTCQIGTYAAGTADAFGHVPGGYTYATAIDCGFRWLSAKEVKNAQDGTRLEADAELRLPTTTAVTTRDRVKVTHRYGTDITDLVFEVAGLGRRGPSATLYYLKQITT